MGFSCRLLVLYTVSCQRLVFTFFMGTATSLYSSLLGALAAYVACVLLAAPYGYVVMAAAGAPLSAQLLFERATLAFTNRI